MLQNYFAIAWRNLRKNKVYSFINILGLAIGLACTIAIAIYILDEHGFDRFHSRFREIYRVVEIQDHEGTLHPVAATPGPLAQQLKNDYTEIIETCRVGRPGGGILTTGEVSIEPSKVLAADNSFFTMFGFQLVRGNSQNLLLKPTELVITASVAEALFGHDWQQNSKVIGHPVVLNNASEMFIAGVAEDCPANSHIQFDVVVSMGYEEIRNPNNVLNWQNHNYHTYIQLAPDADPVGLGEQVHDDLKGKSLWAKPVLLLQPLAEVYLNSHFDYGDWVRTGSVEYLRIFTAVGVVILVIALFNFINLSTARATQRAKEVGVRKVIGAARKQLVFQFLAESVLMTSLAVVLSLLLLLFFIPVLNEISGKSLSIPFTSAWFPLTILGLTIFTAFLSGIYPALYLSGFQPLKALKGFFRTDSGQSFRRSLVVIQFALSVVLVLGTIVIFRQMSFVQDKDLGFDKEQLIFLRMKNNIYAEAASLKAELEGQTSIISVTRTSHNLINMTGSTHSVKWEGQQHGSTFPLCHMNVDPDFVTTTGIELLAGRNFNPDVSSDSSSWLINETAAKQMGWTADEAVGKTLELWSTRGTVVGVLKDFHFRPLTTAIEPMLFHYWPNELHSYQGFFIRTMRNKGREAISIMEDLYRKHDRQTAPQYEFVDQAVLKEYRTEQNTARIVFCFAALAIIVSCLGLFGLTTFSAERRTKEIGIRKVVGASVLDVVKLLSKDFVWLVVIAVVIASPVAWWAMTQWLSGFIYRIEMEWWMVALSGLMAIAVALLTTISLSIKAAMMNPVNTLRTE